MLYTNPKYDKSDDILAAMGYKAGTKGQTDGGGATKPGGSGDTPPPSGGGGSDDRK